MSPAGYSATPLARKLGIREGHAVLLSRPPEDFDAVLGPLPRDVSLHRRAARPAYDVILLFAARRASLALRLPGSIDRLAWTGGLWLCWPKKASGMRTDLSGDKIRRIGLGAGLVDNKVCAVDETWSGLRFVYRVEDRPTPSSSASSASP
ncbi:MAG TPA: hypothetical protein VK837_11905 [Longimicrobiales bacterium]|nr:hypothetical protein [Longimicrobiales bacterium]